MHAPSLGSRWISRILWARRQNGNKRTDGNAKGGEEGADRARADPIAQCVGDCVEDDGEGDGPHYFLWWHQYKVMEDNTKKLPGQKWQGWNPVCSCEHNCVHFVPNNCCPEIESCSEWIRQTINAKGICQGLESCLIQQSTHQYPQSRAILNAVSMSLQISKSLDFIENVTKKELTSRIREQRT
jgi:hypothetical protein